MLLLGTTVDRALTLGLSAADSILLVIGLWWLRRAWRRWQQERELDRRRQKEERQASEERVLRALRCALAELGWPPKRNGV